MHDQRGAVVDRLAQPGRGQRVVDQQRHAGRLGDAGDRLDVADDAAGIGQALDEEGFRVWRDGALEVLRIVGVDDLRRPAELRIGVAHLLQRAAIEARGGDDLRAGRHQREQRQDLRGVARRGDSAAAAAFQRGEPGLEGGVGRVGQPRIDEADGLQVEQGGGLVGIFEHVGRGLIDRQRACAGRRIGGSAGMHGQGLEAVGLVGHMTLHAGRQLAQLNADHSPPAYGRLGGTVVPARRDACLLISTSPV